MKFFATGANAESFSNNEELQLGNAAHPRFRIFNTLKCSACTTMFAPISKRIVAISKTVSF